MANLPNDRLPDEFEVVVQGTGLTQSIIAAAAARIGKKVLHLDGNSFYGELCGTLMCRDLDAWLLRVNSGDIEERPPVTVDTEPLSDDEHTIELLDTTEYRQVFNAVEFIPERVQKSLETPPPPLSVTSPSNEEETVEEESVSQDLPPGVDTAEDSTPLNEESEKPSTEATPPTTTKDDDEPFLTWESLGHKKQRFFNYDILSKLLYCRGSVINWIVDSGVSRYMEFKAVSKLYLYTKDGTFVQTPSSRSDVFSSKIVSMLDKRRLMKFLSFCVEYEEHPDQYKNYENKPFKEFLSAQGLGDILADFIIYSIAFAQDCTSTLEGLKLTQLFLQSLGRFGNAPFLYPIFGVGELPQAYCRLCAVFGGVYCLKRSIKSIITENGNVKGIVCSSGQRIKCSRVISCIAPLKPHLSAEAVKETVVSRAIFISSGPVTRDGEGGLGVVTIPPGVLGNIQKSKIQLIQCDSATLNMTKGIYMVHALYEGEDMSVLKLLPDKLYPSSADSDTPTASSDTPTPILLRALYYNVKLYEIQGRTCLPDAVSVTSDPDLSISYENCMKEAKDIFNEIYPGAEFLPMMPEPDQIVYEEYRPEDNGNHDNKDKNDDNDNDQNNGSQGDEHVENERNT